MHGAGRYGLQCLTNLDLLPPTGSLLNRAALKILKGSGSRLRVLALLPSNPAGAARHDAFRVRFGSVAAGPPDAAAHARTAGRRYGDRQCWLAPAIHGPSARRATLRPAVARHCARRASPPATGSRILCSTGSRCWRYSRLWLDRRHRGPDQYRCDGTADRLLFVEQRRASARDERNSSNAWRTSWRALLRCVRSG